MRHCYQKHWVIAVLPFYVYICTFLNYVMLIIMIHSQYERSALVISDKGCHIFFVDKAYISSGRLIIPIITNILFRDSTVVCCLLERESVRVSFIDHYMAYDITRWKLILPYRPWYFVNIVARFGFTGVKYSFLLQGLTFSFLWILWIWSIFLYNIFSMTNINLWNLFLYYRKNNAMKWERERENEASLPHKNNNAS